MSPRRLLHIPRWLFKLFVFLVLLGCGLVFAATRTQVGRDALSRRLEAGFSRAFDGRLTIGKLQGNLLRDLYASDVQVSDGDGLTVLEIDSVALSASWMDAFRRTMSIRRMELFRPQIHFVRTDSSEWSLVDLFGSDPDTAGSSALWEFRSAEIRITDGAISTRNSGSVSDLIASGRIFDFTNTRFESVNSNVTVDLGAESRLLDVLNFSARIPSLDLSIDDARGQVLLERDLLALSEFSLQTDNSSLSLSGRLTADDVTAMDRRGLRSAVVDARVDVQRLDSADVHALIPGIAWVAGSSLSVNLRGPVSDLDLSGLRLNRGSSSLDGYASVFGLPDSARFTVGLDSSLVTFEDVASFFPALEDPDASGLDSMTVNLRASGTALRKASATHLSVDGEFGIATASGNLEGTFEASPRDSTGSLSFRGQIGSDSFDLGRALPGLVPQTIVRGAARVEASKASGGGVAIQGVLKLGRSRIRGRAMDSLTVALRGDADYIDVRVSGVQGPGSFDVYSVIRGDPLTPRGTWTASFDDLDVGALLKPYSSLNYPRLSGRIDGFNSGNTPSTLTGEFVVSVDSVSAVVGGDSVFVPPTRHIARLVRHEPDSLFLLVEGNVVDLDVRGRLDVEPLTLVAAHWTRGLRRSVDIETAKYYRIDGEPIFGGGLVQNPRVSPDMQVAALESSLRTAGVSDTLSLAASIELKDSGALRIFAPALPSTPGGLRIELKGSASARDLDIQAVALCDSAFWGPSSAFDVHGVASAKTSYSLNPGRHTSLVMQLDANSVSFNKQAFRAFSGQAKFDSGTGSLVLSSDSAASLSTIDFSAQLELGSDQNRITIDRASLSRGGRIWIVDEAPQIDMYADAIHVPGLEVKKYAPGHTESEAGRLSLNGFLSASSQDVFSIRARELDLLDVSELSGFRIPFGGTLNADVRLLSAMEQPIASGTAHVQHLQYDSRDLGDLQLDSRYAPGSGEGMAVGLTLNQPRPPAPFRQRNHLELSGIIDVDNRVSSGSPPLALDIRADTLDLFFFEYIFDTVLDSVRGTAGLEGQIGGTFAKPVFEAAIDFNESNFLVPDYNLRYSVSGPVTVDRDGFHIQNAVLQDETGGIAALRGDILFNDYRFFSFDLAGDLAELQIMNVERSEVLPFYGQIWASGSATLTGPLYNALLRSPDAVTSPRSRVFIPIVDEVVESDQTFIVYADSTGTFPSEPDRRRNVLGRRGRGERTFVDGLDMNFNVDIPRGSSVFLVFDPLLGDIVNSVGSGRVQLQRQGGDFAAFGTFNVVSGDYLFTAGDVFARRFQIASGGTITWDGDPINARLDIPAVYRTRASLAGLPGQNPEQRVALRIDMDLTGRVFSPLVDLRISVDRDNRTAQTIPAGLEAQLNRSDVAAEYASSVLLTNTFLLTTSQGSEGLTETADELLFHSLSQLVSSQVNRFVNEALNLDLNFGVQQGVGTEEYDLTYGFALRLNDERLVIRGEGLYETGTATTNNERLQGAFVIEYRLTPNVQIEFFFRRESDLLEAASSIGTSYGAGFVYQTDFANWKQLRKRVRQRPEAKGGETTSVR